MNIDKFSKNDGLVPPKTGTPIPYACQDCGEQFTKKKAIIPSPVKCPKCGSTKCIQMVCF